MFRRGGLLQIGAAQAKVGKTGGDMSKYQATKQHVSNRGVAPDSFLDELLAWANSQSAIQAGLLEVFESLGDEELGRLSKHLSGEAFDIHPMVDGPNANAVKASIRALSGLGKFLEKEGGLVRWHVQF
jgi:hypothetical protein